jgi:hypothetical protein
VEFLLPLIGWVIGLVIAYFVIRAAVLAALAAHYKTVRWYEATGEWNYGTGGEKSTPRELPASGSSH